MINIGLQQFKDNSLKFSSFRLSDKRGATYHRLHSRWSVSHSVMKWELLIKKMLPLKFFQNSSVEYLRSKRHKKIICHKIILTYDMTWWNLQSITDLNIEKVVNNFLLIGFYGRLSSSAVLHRILEMDLEKKFEASFF